MISIRLAACAVLAISIAVVPFHRSLSETRPDDVPDELKVLPMALALRDSPAATKDTVMFVWSRDCEDCRVVFQRDIAPFVDGPAKNRISVSLIQYETDDKMIDRILEVTCHGNSAYTWAALSYLYKGRDEATAEKREPAYVKSKRTYLCANKVLARKNVVRFMKEIRREHKLSRTPAIFLNGRELADRAELEALK
jgi:hypothetical protein